LSQFLLVDPALGRPGGHHHRAALLWGAEAERRGHRVTLAVRHDARGLEDAVASGWASRRVFRHALDAWPQSDALARRRVESTARGLERLLSGAQAEDLLFFPTVHPLDLDGLALALERCRPAPLRIHLQHLYPLLDGRPSEWPAQADAMARHRATLERLRAASARHRLEQSAVTAQLARQHRLLGAGPLPLVPYPISAPEPSGEAPPPLRGAPRLVLAGGSRNEKGRRRLAALIDLLRPRLASGTLRLVVQSGGAWLERWLPRLGPGGDWRAAFDRRAEHRASVLRVPHPLAEDDYRRLLESSDLALFLHDARRYASRHSGVFCDARAAGLPVLVRARTWMADELEATDRGYFERLRATASAAPAVGAASAEPARMLARNQDGEALLLECSWEDRDGLGPDLEVELAQLDAGGRAVKREVRALSGFASGEGARRAFLVAHPRRDCRAVAVAARGLGETGATAPQISLSPSWLRDPAPAPVGATGLTYRDLDELPERVDQMLDHLDHFRLRAHEAAAGELRRSRLIWPFDASLDQPGAGPATHG
jgi:hypothetical protein